MQHDVVKDYYGKILKTSADLKTSACCSPEQLPAYIRALERNVTPTSRKNIMAADWSRRRS